MPEYWTTSILRHDRYKDFVLVKVFSFLIYIDTKTHTHLRKLQPHVISQSSGNAVNFINSSSFTMVDYIAKAASGYQDDFSNAFYGRDAL